MGKVKSFEITFNDTNKVYYPGQQVTGKVMVELESDMKLRAIRVYMRGLAKVHWTESRSTTSRLGTIYTEHYNAEIEYFFKRQELFGSLAETGEVRAHAWLPQGHHEFDFAFQLPTDGISTSFEGKYGSVRYWLKAEIDKPWSFNHSTKRAFTVISPIDINLVEYLSPVESGAEKMLCCWCLTSGPVSINARTDRRGYCPGESIAITADFENYSSRPVIPHATLYQTQTFLAGGKSRSRRYKFTILTGLQIQPGRKATWDAQLLKIPAVSPSIVNCCLIKIEYTVRVTLQIPGSYNLSLDLPIVVGTVPLRGRLPHYRAIDVQAMSDARVTYVPPAPAYREQATPPPPFDSYGPPPTYMESVEGAVDIRDEDDGDEQEGVMGDFTFTPMYTYVTDYQYHQQPPPYSEIDPHPTASAGPTAM
ncbi:PREDICTED: arrestin domain-containing protein 3-like [Priapulus caudatus]|uniref:Arrestin domain-containing protein 3-like n=1 Tax=Priapulus caudatus TaxID=37621 RepID=A0ABM1DNM3_PRICU|nr:PREDICTED: arrestin domain-containing protein 3-like [Priapulus caudatus]